MSDWELCWRFASPDFPMDWEDYRFSGSFLLWILACTRLTKDTGREDGMQWDGNWVCHVRYTAIILERIIQQEHWFHWYTQGIVRKEPWFTPYPKQVVQHRASYSLIHAAHRLIESSCPTLHATHRSTEAEVRQYKHHHLRPTERRIPPNRAHHSQGRSRCDSVNATLSVSGEAVARRDMQYIVQLRKAVARRRKCLTRLGAPAGSPRILRAERKRQGSETQQPS